MNYERELTALYVAFNAREIDQLLDAMTDDVDWPNAREGGRLHGKEAIRDYWTRQWSEIDPTVEPVSFTQATRRVYRGRRSAGSTRPRRQPRQRGTRRARLHVARRARGRDGGRVSPSSR